MLNSKTILNAFIALTFVTAAVPLTAGSAQAYVCKSQIVKSVGYGRTEKRAKLTAADRWSAVAKHKYGLAWSVWNISKDKGLRCKRTGKVRHLCQVVSKPCLYVVK